MALYEHFEITDNINFSQNAKDAIIENANAELRQWKRKHESVEKECQSLHRHQEDLAHMTKKEAQAMEIERLALEEQLDEKKVVIEELSGTNRRLKDENESHSMQTSKLEEQLGFLENEIRVMTEKEMDHIDSLNQKIDAIYKLEEKIRHLQEVRAAPYTYSYIRRYFLTPFSLVPYRKPGTK